LLIFDCDKKNQLNQPRKWLFVSWLPAPIGEEMQIPLHDRTGASIIRGNESERKEKSATAG